MNSDGETIVDVRKGSAEISTPQGSTHVERDQRITIQGNADNAQYQISGAPGSDDWDKWNSDRDHMIESAQSWQHTNPYYTGTQDLDTQRAMDECSRLRQRVVSRRRSRLGAVPRRPLGL